MEELRFSETSVKFYRTTWRPIREDNTQTSNWCENLKAKKKKIGNFI
jgi:hypothetical protein